MKKFFSYAILLFLAAMYMAGCGSGSNTKTAEAVPMTVDSLLAVAGDRIGDSVVVEGFCKTICKKCGRKLFLTGDDSTKTLRIESGESIGMFDAGAVHAIVRVEGRIMEQRIDEDYLQQWADRPLNGARAPLPPSKKQPRPISVGYKRGSTNTARA